MTLAEQFSSQNQLEAAANALKFSWTADPPSNPDSFSSEAEAGVQMKTEVDDDDDCEIVCDMPPSSRTERLTSESEMEAAGSNRRSSIQGCFFVQSV